MIQALPVCWHALWNVLAAHTASSASALSASVAVSICSRFAAEMLHLAFSAREHEPALEALSQSLAAAAPQLAVHQVQRVFRAVCKGQLFAALAPGQSAQLLAWVVRDVQAHGFGAMQLEPLAGGASSATPDTKKQSKQHLKQCAALGGLHVLYRGCLTAPGVTSAVPPQQLLTVCATLITQLLACCERVGHAPDTCLLVLDVLSVAQQLQTHAALTLAGDFNAGGDGVAVVAAIGRICVAVSKVRWPLASMALILSAHQMHCTFE